MHFTRNGRDGRKWSWSDGGWRGDGLGVFRGEDVKLHPVELKTDYDADSGTYKLTFNLPLGGLERSTWVLTRR